MSKSTWGTPINSGPTSNTKGFGSTDSPTGKDTALDAYGRGAPLTSKRGGNDDNVEAHQRIWRGEHSHLNVINRNGVVFDFGLGGGEAPALDSPVPAGAQRPLQNQGAIAYAMAIGEGANWSREDGVGNAPSGVLSAGSGNQ